MKLIIVDSFSKDNLEFSLVNKKNNISNEYEKVILYENKKYSLIVDLTSLVQVEDVNIYIGDMPLSIKYDNENKVIKYPAEYIFIDCYDMTKIQIEILYQDNTIEIYTTHNIFIAVPKTTNLYIEKMLNDIENNYNNILEACFSKNKKQSGMSSIGYRGIDSTILLLDEIYNSLKNMFFYFQNNSITYLTLENNITNISNVEKITPENISWVLKHPESLKQIKTYSPIKINNNFYEIQKMESYQKKETKDLYENRVVLGFINHIIIYITDLYNNLQESIENGMRKNIHNMEVQLEKNYDLTNRCITFYYAEISNKLSYYIDIFNSLFNAYKECLECEVIEINTIPRYTFIFRQKFHYNQCFENMVKWFEYGEYNLNSFEYFFKMKKLSKIFEYYTLIKILDGIVKNGGILCGEKNIIYDNENICNINNCYEYILNYNNSVRLSVYYEPYIYRNKIENGINLYCTGFNFTKEMKEVSYWTPDFVIKVSIENIDIYYILDSKFSSYSTVKKYRLKDISNKYILGIASRNKYHSQVLGLWAVFPSLENKDIIFKKNNVDSDKVSLPIIGIHSLSTDTTLEKLIRDIICTSSDYFENIFTT